jgi:hypothetical protein
MTLRYAAEQESMALGELADLEFRQALDLVLAVVDEFPGPEGRSLALLALERAKVNAP